MHNVLNFIHTSNFYIPEQIKGLTDIVQPMKYIPCEFGEITQNFNYIQPESQKIFSQVLNTEIVIDPKSGHFYKPGIGIHFDTFENMNTWKFVVAIEPTIFTMFHHQSGAKSALEGTNFNYRNMFEWEYQTQIMMEPGQGLFYRPWMFHSFGAYSIIQTFNIQETPKAISKTILVMGSKGSGKTIFAEKLSDKLKATYINSDSLKNIFKDSYDELEGENVQAERLKHMAILSETEYTVIDFKCERNSSRDYLSPDLIIWLNTVEKNSDIFEEPTKNTIVIKSLDYDIDKFAMQIFGV